MYNSPFNSNTGFFGRETITNPTPNPGYNHPSDIPKIERPALYTAEDEALLRQSYPCECQLTKEDLQKILCLHKNASYDEENKQYTCPVCGAIFSPESDSPFDKMSTLKVRQPGLFWYL